MDNNNAVSGGGVGIGGMLLVLFVALKLTGVISWSWVWVLSPVWIPATIVVVLLALAAVFVHIGNRLS